MGCFNVACSVSGISINNGDPVVFIPLVPKTHYRTGIPTIEPKTLLHYSNCYFTPFCLPIYGEYNDYGGVENVEMDANVKAIQKFTGMPIEEFIDSLGRGRSYASSCWEASERFFKFTKLMEYDVKLNEKFITTLGFKKNNENGRYHLDGLKFTLELIPSGWGHKKDENGYTIYNEKNEQVYSSAHDDKEEFLTNFAKHTKYFLGVDPKHHQIVKILLNLSGMFIHKDVWDELVRGSTEADAYPTPKTLEVMGFKFLKNCPQNYERHKAKLYTHPENENILIRARDSEYAYTELLKTENDPWGQTIYNWYVLAETLISEYGVGIDASELESISAYSQWFDNLQERVHAYDSLNKKTKGKHYYSLTPEELQEVLPTLTDIEADMFKFMRSPLRDRDSGSMREFEGWHYLEDIYQKCIADGSIKKNMTDWMSATSTMHSANVFFFPAMNGEQHGNHEVSKRVLEAALGVVNAKLKEHEE